VLLVLPSTWDSSGLSAADANNLLRLEQQLLSAPAAVPVFFAKETDALADAVRHAAAQLALTLPKHCRRWTKPDLKPKLARHVFDNACLVAET
jgi:hypothetical protein